MELAEVGPGDSKAPAVSSMTGLGLAEGIEMSLDLPRAVRRAMELTRESKGPTTLAVPSYPLTLIDLARF